MISFSFKDAEIAIRNIAQSIVGSTYPVIYARQNAPRPQTDYITIDTLNVSNVGGIEQLYDTENTDKFKLIQNFTMVVSFIAVGKECNNLLSKLDMHLTGNPLIIDELFTQASVIPQGRSTQIDITAMLDTGYEPRAIMDITFSGSIVDDNVDIGIIESVQIDGNGGGDDPYDHGIIYEAQSPHYDGDVLWTSDLIIDPN